MRCTRRGCDNILCDNQILVGLHDLAYICDRCWSDLKAWKGTWTSSVHKDDVQRMISQFMDGSVGHRDGISTEAEEEFQRITCLCDIDDSPDMLGEDQ